jgi:hypothetical protein
MSDKKTATDRTRKDVEPATPKPADRNREAALDEALEETFPASDPVAIGHSDHAGEPPNHQGPVKERPKERD